MRLNLTVACLALVSSGLSGCGASAPPVETVQEPPQAPAFQASFPCTLASFSIQQAVCSDQHLATLDVAVAGALRRHLGDDDLIQRDQVLASQRGWLIGLAATCPQSAGHSAVIACLSAQYEARLTALTQWQTITPPWKPAALQNYVTYKAVDSRDPALCSALTAGAPRALSKDGSLDPRLLSEGIEIAGTHGPASGVGPGGEDILVDMGRAGLYAGYQKRARAVHLNGGAQPAIDPNSLGRYARMQPNSAGRFNVFASQTGDYGAIDVVSRGAQTLALVTDAIGYYAPANAGETALAAIFSLSPTGAVPVCLFTTYLKAPYQGVFAEQPSLTPFLALLDAIHGAPPEQLADSDREDTTQLADETRWRLLNMPMVEIAEVRSAGWTGWLRYRHDLVLDALFSWSQKSTENKANFDKLFALLRPAAADLARIYQQTQGMSGSDAEQATALTMMELLYQSTTYLAPDLAAGPSDPKRYEHSRPRYPILASPQA